MDDQKHDQKTKKLDLAFSMDTTASMNSYIVQARNSVRQIVEEIVSREHADVRLALVEYRDHPPQDNSFVTRVHDFTSSVREMKGWLDAAEARGGGDIPEAVADALHQVLKLSWRDDATKMCVFISDAPPHGLIQSGDGFPGGCPDGLDCMKISNDLAGKGVTLYMVGCEPAIDRYKDFFHSLAVITGGQYVPLKRSNLLAEVIMGGAQEELSLQDVAQDVNADLMEQIQLTQSDSLDMDAVVENIHKKMLAKGTKAKQLNLNSNPLPIASDCAVTLSNLTSMEAVRKEWKPATATVRSDRYDRIDSDSHIRTDSRPTATRTDYRPPKRSFASASYGIESDGVESDGFGEAESDSFDVNDVESDGIESDYVKGAASGTSDSFGVTDYIPIEKEQIARLVQRATRANNVTSKFNKK